MEVDSEMLLNLTHFKQESQRGSILRKKEDDRIYSADHRIHNKYGEGITFTTFKSKEF